MFLMQNMYKNALAYEPLFGDLLDYIPGVEA